MHKYADLAIHMHAARNMIEVQKLLNGVKEQRTITRVCKIAQYLNNCRFL